MKACGPESAQLRRSNDKGNGSRKEAFNVGKKYLMLERSVQYVKRVRLLLYAIVLAAVNYVVHIELEKEGQGYPQILPTIMHKPMKMEQLPSRALGLSFSSRRGAPIWTHIRVQSRGKELGSNYQSMSTKEFVAICERLNETWHILAF